MIEAIGVVGLCRRTETLAEWNHGKRTVRELPMLVVGWPMAIPGFSSRIRCAMSRAGSPGAVTWGILGRVLLSLSDDPPLARNTCFVRIREW